MSRARNYDRRHRDRERSSRWNREFWRLLEQARKSESVGEAVRWAVKAADKAAKIK